MNYLNRVNTYVVGLLCFFSYEQAIGWESFCCFVEPQSVPNEVQKIHKDLQKDLSKLSCILPSGSHVVAALSCSGEIVNLPYCFLSGACEDKELVENQYKKYGYECYPNVRTAKEMLEHAEKFFAPKCAVEDNFGIRCGNFSAWADLKNHIEFDIEEMQRVAKLGKNVYAKDIDDSVKASIDLLAYYNRLKGNYWHSEQQLIEYLNKFDENKKKTKLEVAIDKLELKVGEKKLLTLHIHTSLSTCHHCGPSLVNAKNIFNTMLTEKNINAEITQVVISFDEVYVPQKERLQKQNDDNKKRKINFEIKEGSKLENQPNVPYWNWKQAVPPYVPMFQLLPKDMSNKNENTIENKEIEIKKDQNQDQKK